MGLTIEDGSGGGYQARIDSLNRLHVYSIVESLEHHTNLIHGESYNLLFSQTATGAGDCILYIRNLNDEQMIFEGITINTATDETIEIVLNDIGDPVGGVELTPVNLNTGVNNEAEGIFQGGNNITGLNGGSSCFRFFLKGGDSSKFFEFDQDIIIAKNKVLTIYCVNGSILVNGKLSFYFPHEN